jgi:uncharacterized protein (DUF433 family)
MLPSEVIDWSKCPIVEFDPEKMGGKATVRAWRITADSIVDNRDEGMSAEEIAEVFDLPLADVKTILDYAEENRQLVDSL